MPIAKPQSALVWKKMSICAAEKFEVEHFRTGQRALIVAALEGRDVIGLLATGMGKSLCFQLPALFLSGVTVVVTPLIALMHDQRSKLVYSATGRAANELAEWLASLGIACAVYSGMTK